MADGGRDAVMVPGPEDDYPRPGRREERREPLDDLRRRRRGGGQHVVGVLEEEGVGGGEAPELGAGERMPSYEVDVRREALLGGTEYLPLRAAHVRDHRPAPEPSYGPAQAVEMLDDDRDRAREDDEVGSLDRLPEVII